MAQLNRNEQSVFLKFLLEDQAAELARSRAAAVFMPGLRAALSAFAAQDRLPGARPAAPEGLTVAVRVQDAKRLTVLNLAEVVSAGGEAAAPVGEALRLAASMPSRRSYVDRVARLPALEAQALALEGQVAGLEPALGAVVSAAMSAYVEATRALAILMSAHAHAVSHGPGERGLSIATRMSVTSRLLGQLRGAVRVEVEADAGLPRDLEFRLFGFHDELLSGARARQAARRAGMTRVAPEPTAPESFDADEATG